MVMQGQASHILTIEEVASVLYRAPRYLQDAITRGDLVPTADGGLTLAAVVAFVGEQAARDAALRAALTEGDQPELGGSTAFERLIALGIVDPDRGEGDVRGE